MLKTRLVAASLAVMLGATLLGANDAAAQKVATNYDTKVDFTQYKTYNRQAIDSTLSTKGMTKADGDNANVYVAYQISVQQSTQYNTFGTGPGMAGGWGWGGGMSTTTPQTINTGTLVVDLYDPAMKQLVWQSTATKQMNPSSDAAKNQANLQKAVNKMFKNYPPEAKGK